MTNRKPLVIVNGQIQQLQSGDAIDVPTNQPHQFSLTNSEASPVVIGTPVYIYGDDAVKKAKADAAGTSKLVGLVADASVSGGSAGMVQTDNIFTATTGQWDTVAGTTGGLTANTTYFLDPATSGKITSTPPSTLTQLVVRVGTAISTTQLDISSMDKSGGILL